MNLRLTFNKMNCNLKIEHLGTFSLSTAEFKHDKKSMSNWSFVNKLNELVFMSASLFTLKNIIMPEK